MNAWLALATGVPDLGSGAHPASPVAALLITLGVLYLLKRTADQDARLRKTERELREAIERESRNDAATLLLGLVLSGWARGAQAQPPEPVPAALPSPSASPSPSPSPEAHLQLGAAVETFFAWNFNRPGNGVTAFRGFDARHNTFALSNAVLDARWTAGSVSGRVALQTGDTPDIYYGSEATSDIRHVLEATLGWKSAAARGPALDAGLFLSPIGPESILVKDNWTWSRSTLFFALPFYHAGVRATLPVTGRTNVTAGLFNGWNSVTDTNGRKSFSVQFLHTRPDRLSASVLYFGGVERPRGAPEGQAWRHLFDAHVTARVSRSVSIQAHADTGFESTAFGRASWRAAALTARVTAAPWLFAAARIDTLSETIPASAQGIASPLFFPTRRVWSVTATLEARPAERLAARLEFRRDAAANAIYFRGGADASLSRTQSTLTFGVTAWF